MGGWGKPPVDEMGRPLYGDVFGLDNPDNSTFYLLSLSPYLKGVWQNDVAKMDMVTDSERMAINLRSF